MKEGEGPVEFQARLEGRFWTLRLRRKREAWVELDGFGTREWAEAAGAAVRDIWLASRGESVGAWPREAGS